MQKVIMRLYTKYFVFSLLVAISHCNDREEVWKKLNNNPSPVVDYGGHRSCLLKSKVYIFGGVTENRTLAIDFNEGGFTDFKGTTFAFDLGSLTWNVLIHEEDSTVPKPSPRGFFGMACLDGSSRRSFGHHSGASMYLFGGLTETFAPSDELWRYDVSDNAWELIPKNGVWPAPRSSSILKHMTSDHRDVLVLYGGANAFFGEIGETWIYDIEARIWTQGPTLPRGNINPMSTVHKNRLYIYGGEREPYPGSARDGTWRWATEVYRFNPNTLVWRLVVNNTAENLIINRAYAASGSLREVKCTRDCKEPFWYFVGGDYGIWRNGSPVLSSDCTTKSVGVDYLVGEVLRFFLDRGEWGNSYLPEYLSPVSPYKISVIDRLGLEPPDDRTTVAHPGTSVIPALKRSDMVCDEEACYITGGWGGVGTRAETLVDQFYNNNIWKFSP